MAEHILGDSGKQYIDNTSRNIENNDKNADNNGDYEVIRLEGVPPLSDPNCEHTFVKDDDDLSPDQQAWICTQCHRGTFLPNNIKIT